MNYADRLLSLSQLRYWIAVLTIASAGLADKRLVADASADNEGKSSPAGAVVVLATQADENGREDAVAPGAPPATTAEQLPVSKRHDPKERLKLIEQVYDRNRALFRAFTCKFRVIKGCAKNMDDALSGRLEDAVHWSGLWIVDGADARYELRCSRPIEVEFPTETSLRTPNGGVMTGARYLPEIELCSGKHQTYAGVSEVLDCVNLTRGAGFRAITTPISLGVMGRGESCAPVEAIRGAREGRWRCRYAGHSIVDEATVDAIEADGDPERDGAPLFTWYLDVRRGCIPVKTVFRDPDGSLSGSTFATSIKKCENGGYICDRAVMTWPQTTGLGVKIIELVSIDLSEPPRDSLALLLQPSTTVVDTKDMRSSFRLEETEKFHVDEFDVWLQRCDAALRQRLME